MEKVGREREGATATCASNSRPSLVSQQGFNSNKHSKCKHGEGLLGLLLSDGHHAHVGNKHSWGTTACQTLATHWEDSGGQDRRLPAALGCLQAFRKDRQTHT